MLSRPTCLLAATALVVSVPALARAQVNPSQPIMPGSGEPEGDEKPEGVAEEAPTTPGALPTTPVLPPPRAKRKRFELIEVNGYFRFRGDWLKNLSLGFNDLGPGGAPFPRPLGCNPGAPAGSPCDDTVKSSNIRLRLEPVIHLDERASVHIQADVLDNLVLGSTPDGQSGGARPNDLPLGAFTDNQVPPEQGKNSNHDAIVIKRAWADVETPLGQLKFGRQPSQWGLGIYANGGGYDPMHATYDLDADYGDTVDRLSFSNEIPGTNLRGLIATDWAQTSPSSAQTDLFATRSAGGQPWNLENNDDLSQWTFILSRLDSPTVFADKTAQGELALNYGAYLSYRTQAFDQTGVTVGSAPDPTKFVKRGLTAYIPDLWARMATRDWELEAEGVAQLGSISSVADAGIDGELSIRTLGGVARGSLRFMGGDLRLGLELGYASGDQWDNDPQGATHVSHHKPLPGPGDSSINQFMFDPDYKIDLILFRELIGSVTNTTYIRPTFDYDINERFSAKINSVISFANNRVATPGNGIMYGVELDGDMGYHHDGFFAGIAYGLFFPLGAMNHPADTLDQGGPGFGYGTNAGDASTAQTIQTRLTLQF